jgi:hypothetical protein
VNDVSKILIEFKEVARTKGSLREIDDRFISFAKKFLCGNNERTSLNNVLEVFYAFPHFEKLILSISGSNKNGFINGNWLEPRIKRGSFSPLFTGKDTDQVTAIKQQLGAQPLLEKMLQFYNLVFLFFIAYELDPDEEIFFLSKDVAFKEYVSSSVISGNDSYYNEYLFFFLNYYRFQIEDVLLGKINFIRILYRDTPFYLRLESILSYASKEYKDISDFFYNYGIHLHSLEVNKSIRALMFFKESFFDYEPLLHRSNFDLNSQDLGLSASEITKIMNPIIELIILFLRSITKENEGIIKFYNNKTRQMNPGCHYIGNIETLDRASRNIETLLSRGNELSEMVRIVFKSLFYEKSIYHINESLLNNPDKARLLICHDIQSALFKITQKISYFELSESCKRFGISSKEIDLTYVEEINEELFWYAKFGDLPDLSVVPTDPFPGPLLPYYFVSKHEREVSEIISKLLLFFRHSR